MRRPNTGQGSDDRKGFIVVAVLWLLAALATLATIYSLNVRTSVAAFAGRDDRLAVQALVRAGVDVAAQQITANPTARPSYGSLAVRLGGADVSVAFRSENGLIDLNAAPKEVLTGLFVGLGARPQDADYVADRIIAWRTPLKSGGTDEETSLYRVAGKPYGPRRGPFQHVNEVALVLGMPPVWLDRAVPHFTVYSGQAEVNVLSATAEVLAALPGVSPERLHDFVGLRGATMPQDVLRARLGQTERYITVMPSNATRIQVDVRFADRRPVRSEVVAFILAGDVEPYRVLSWRQDIAAPSESR